MGKTVIRLNGAKELQQKLLANKRELAPKVGKIVAKNTNEMATVTKQNMMGAYTHGYSTGTTARSVLATLENGGLTGIVSPSTEYFPYLEYGTRFMSPMPTLHPAFSQQTVKFESDLNKLMK